MEPSVVDVCTDAYQFLGNDDMVKSRRQHQRRPTMSTESIWGSSSNEKLYNANHTAFACCPVQRRLSLPVSIVHRRIQLQQGTEYAM
ncbi:hypothetical protein BFJ70_g16778 [Fusarium oxysporum]|nr:hypothetical protein BFJ70_g16778 [Fusarium oxysporum]